MEHEHTEKHPGDYPAPTPEELAGLRKSFEDKGDPQPDAWLILYHQELQAMAELLLEIWLDKKEREKDGTTERE